MPPLRLIYRGAVPRPGHQCPSADEIDQLCQLFGQLPDVTDSDLLTKEDQQ